MIIRNRTTKTLSASLLIKRSVHRTCRQRESVGTDLVSVRVGMLLADGHKVRPYGSPRGQAILSL